MAWFFRVIEQDDGRWACRHGRQEYDTHPRLDQTIEHIKALAAQKRPAQLSFIAWTALSKAWNSSNDVGGD